MKTPLPSQSRAALTLLALGVVYGDIGTSPLYAVRETFSTEHGIPLSATNVIGGISAIFWSIMLVVSLKYVTVILNADNRGEGGILALLALALAALRHHPRRRAFALFAGLTGAALFYGDAVLTPAVSVVSAVEGLQVGTDALTPYVIPASCGVLIALFLFQRHGTGTVGMLFGPVTLLWFVALAAAGIYGIASEPRVLHALNPLHGIAFVTRHGFSSFVVLGAVLLAFTGAEALYADMGHFGRGPVRVAWFRIVLPALTLNYLGQGALLMDGPVKISNPFYLLVPEWALYPMVALATAATVIASQATISGAYSLTRQAIQLDFLPRMNVIQTSPHQYGQIYMPGVNFTLLVVILAVVIGFGTSAQIASAYGVAVTGTMLITTALMYFVARSIWHVNATLCFAVAAGFFTVDAAFFFSSLLKLDDGGWFPVVVAVCILLIFLTWRRGRKILFEELQRSALPLEPFLESLLRDAPARVQGTAVFLTAMPNAVPHALLHNLKHNKVLHQRLVFLTVDVREVPWIDDAERVEIENICDDCWRVRIKFGFMQPPDVAEALNGPCRLLGLIVEMMETSFFVSRETVIPVKSRDSGMAMWRERAFVAMARNAHGIVEYFNIPANRVIELGTQIEI